jgi:hypothetical protein
MCSFIVVHERSITKCDLINNIIKTILLCSIGLFLFFSEFMALFRGVFIQCRYGLSGVILFIFLIILNIWIYYTINFCRFTFCFYVLMAKQTNRGKRSVFNETHLQKIFFKNWRTTKLSRLFWGVVVFRHHVIIDIEMLSKWRHPSIVDRILKSISFPYPT